MSTRGASYRRQLRAPLVLSMTLFMVALELTRLILFVYVVCAPFCLGTSLPTSGGCGTIIQAATCEPACSRAIEAAVVACSKEGGGSIFLGSGEFPLASQRSLLPSLVLENVHNVVITGTNNDAREEQSACTSPTSASSRLVLQQLAGGVQLSDSSNITFQDLHITSGKNDVCILTCTEVKYYSLVCLIIYLEAQNTQIAHAKHFKFQVKHAFCVR